MCMGRRWWIKKKERSPSPPPPPAPLQPLAKTKTKQQQQDQPSSSHSHSQSQSQSQSPSPSLPSSSTDLPTPRFSPVSSSSSLTSLRDLVSEGPLLYKRAEIDASTNRFSASCRLSGSVWRGMLRQSPVAVVRRHVGRAKDLKPLLRIVSSLHHSNVTRLLGACRDRELLFLVYELVEGQNLALCLDNKLVPGYTVLSTWRLRLQVALDIAKGLEYLHEHSSLRAIHKHLSSRTILLTKQTLRAKIAFTGMAVLTGEVEVDFLNTKYVQEAEETPIAGTKGDALTKKSATRAGSIKIEGRQGYMSPEYMSSGEITLKYDVFAFGVVLVDLLKGKDVTTFRQTSPMGKPSPVDELRQMVQDRDGLKKNLRLWIDPRLNDSYPVEDAAKLALLACSCLNKSPAKRPTMSEVSGKLAKFLNSAGLWERERNAMTGTFTLEAR